MTINHNPIALIGLGTVISYLARNTLSVLAPQLQTQMHVSTAKYSYVVAAFQIAYTLMQPVCGFVVDRLGLRLGFALFAVAGSLANIGHDVGGFAGPKPDSELSLRSGQAGI